MSIQDIPLIDRSKLTYTSPEFPARREIPSLAALATEALEFQANFSLPPSRAFDLSMSIEDQIEFVEGIITKFRGEEAGPSDRNREIPRRETDYWAYAPKPGLDSSDEEPAPCSCRIF